MKNKKRRSKNKSISKRKDNNNKRIKENTSLTVGDTTLNTIVNASTSIAVQFQFDAPTLEECWEVVHERYITKKSKDTQRNYVCAYRKFSSLSKRKINTITLNDLQPLFDAEMEKGAVRSTLCNMKCVLNYIFDYAMKYDYAFKFYPEYIEFEVTKSKVIQHTPFSLDEIKKIYEHAENGSVACQLIMIYIYTGMRPMEFANMQSGDIHLDEGYMVGGVKTNAGKKRIIPIHPVIKTYIKKALDRKGNKEYMLFNYCGRYAVNKYRDKIFNPTMDVLCMNHYCYDTRHTFATLANEYHMDEIATKRIMGHITKDLTKDVYTHTTVAYLTKQISKIPYPDKLDAEESKFSRIMSVIRGDL